MQTLYTNRKKFNELKKNPLFFMHIEYKSCYDKKSGSYIDKPYWIPIDPELSGGFEARDVKQWHYLFVAGKEIKTNNNFNNESVEDYNENGSVEFEIRDIDASKQDDWLLAVNSFLKRSNNKEDKIPYIHFLWLINNNYWYRSVLTDILVVLKNNNIDNFNIIIKGLFRISKCLCSVKQAMIQDVLSKFGYSYNVYSPDALRKAVEVLYPEESQYIKNYDIFRLVDLLFEDDEQHHHQFPEQDYDNPFIQLYKWIKGEYIIINTDYIKSLYSLVSNQIKLKIIRRYFDDIRFGYLSFNEELLSQFVDNPYSDFIWFRYCIITPEERINLAAPLLCDCIKTIVKTDGQDFQSFDGIMDFAMKHCDVTKPNITLGLTFFLPKCDGGVVYNQDFYGFIDYGIVFRLDEEKFTPENLTSSILSMLNSRPHKQYTACGNDDRKKPLTNDQRSHCCAERIIVINEQTGEKRKELKFNCAIQCQYDNVWIVRKSDYTWLNLFLKEPLNEPQKNEENEIIEINLSDTSTEILEENIKKWADSFVINSEEKIKLFEIKSDKLYITKLIVDYSKALYLRIYPQKSAIIGYDFDVFNIKQDVWRKINENQPSKKDLTKEDIENAKKYFYERESKIIYNKIILSLKNELGVNEYNGDYFELKYDRELLKKIIRLYYYRGSITENTDEKNRKFLKKQNVPEFAPFCAPEIADEKNRATGLPFFWCRGMECFRNHLGNQTLNSKIHWSEYSLYHIIEILGYPKLHMTDAGLEPDKTVRKFIGVANKVIKKFKRLKCRECGHLMFTHQDNIFNRHYYFSCKNPECCEFNIPVYLNYCFKCKKGLIDSRDGKKCPNGSFICTDCLACCSDEMFERQAQKYAIEKKPIPSWLQNVLGKGHNDKEIYFCPKCGSQLGCIEEGDYATRICSNCNIQY